MNKKIDEILKIGLIEGSTKPISKECLIEIKKMLEECLIQYRERLIDLDRRELNVKIIKNRDIPKSYDKDIFFSSFNINGESVAAIQDLSSINVRKIKFGLMDIPENPSIRIKNEVHVPKTLKSETIENIPKINKPSFCKKCNCRNEYVDYNPDYICYGCKNF